MCQPFWMENFVRTQLGDGESNCGEAGPDPSRPCLIGCDVTWGDVLRYDLGYDLGFQTNCISMRESIVLVIIVFIIY